MSHSVLPKRIGQKRSISANIGWYLLYVLLSTPLSLVEALRCVFAQKLVLKQSHHD